MALYCPGNSTVSPPLRGLSPQGHLWHDPEGCQRSSWHVPAGRGRMKGTWEMAAEHRMLGTKQER